MKKINLFSKFLILALFICATNSNGQNINVGMSISTPIPADYMGLNSANTVRTDADFPYIDDNWLVDSLDKMSIGNLRFPPGTYGNFWDWHLGSIKDESKLPHDDDFLLDLGNLKYKDNSFDRLKNTIEKTGAAHIYAMNILNSDKYYEAAGLYYLNSLNLTPKYIEMGDELYNDFDSYVGSFPTSKSYADKVNDWSSYIKGLPGLSNIKICAVGATNRSSQPDYSRRNTWNKEVCSFLSNDVDAIALHFYLGANLGGQPLTTANMNDFMAAPFIGFSKLQEELTTVKAAGKEAWITEFNIYDRNTCVNGSMAHALYLGSLSLCLLEDPNITKYCAHALTGNATWALLFNNSTGFETESYYYPGISCNPNPPATVAHDFTAPGTVIKMIGNAISNATSRKKLSFPACPKIGDDYDAVYGWMFDGPLAEEAIILNLSATQTTININSNQWNLSNATYEQVYPGSGGVMDFVTGSPTKGSVAGRPRTTGVLSAGQTLILKPYSITRISKKKNTITLKAVDSKICSGTTTTLIANGGTSYTFNGSGLVGLVSKNVIKFSANVTAQKTYTITVTDINGASATASITVYPSPQLTVGISKSVVCAKGTPVNLTASLTGGNSNNVASYLWIPNQDITNPNSGNTVAKPSKTTTYTVYATDGQCYTAYDSVKVVVSNQAPPATFYNVCSDALPYQIKIDNPQSGFTYKWYEGNNVVYTGTSFSANPQTLVTKYKVEMVSNSNSGCIDSTYTTLNNYKCCTAPVASLTFQPGAHMKDIRETIFDYCELTGKGVADEFGVSNLQEEILFNGVIYVDANYSFTNCKNIKFGEDAELRLIDFAYDLEFHTCSLSNATCATSMWKGISITEFDQQVVLDNCYITNAKCVINAERDPILYITNTTFDANYVSICLNKNDKEFRGTIEGCTFTQSHSMMPPFLGKKPCAHIKINNVSSMKVGNPLGAINNFEKAEYGIYAINSNLTVYNNLFNNIRSSDQINEGKASCIYLENSNGYGNLTDINQLWKLYNINAGKSDNSPNYNNVFKNSRNGIYGVNCGINSYYNQFDNCKRGIKVIGGMLKRFNLIGNYINNSFASIDLIDCKNSKIIIDQNTINTDNVTSYNQVYFGIRVVDDPNAVSTLDITNNVINNLATYGIWVQNTRLADIVDNKFYFNHNGAVQESYGLVIENADSVDVDCNLFAGNNTGDTYLSNKTGLSMSFTPMSRVRCNTTDKMNKGMEFLGDCDNSQIRNNDFKYLNYGFVIGAAGVSGGTIGAQPLTKDSKPNNNVFYGKYTLQNGTGKGKGKFGNAATLSVHSDLSGTLGSENQFLAFDEDSLQVPYQNAAIGVGATPITPGYTIREPRICESSCLNPNPDKQAVIQNEIIDNNALLPQNIENIERSIPYSKNTAVIWEIKKSLLEFIEANPAVLYQNNELQQTYNLLSQTNIKSFSNLERLIKNLGNYNGNNFGKEILLKQIEDENQAILPLNKVEQNEQFINQMSISIFKGQLQDILKNDFVKIKALSMACPYTEGAAVYKARLLYNLVDDEYIYNDKQACKGAIDFTPEENFDNVQSSVFPNPSNGVFNLKVFTDKTDDKQLNVMDLTGKVIFTKSMGDLNTVNVDMKDYPAGMYLYTVTIDGKPIAKGKIIVE